jgi:AcrR family transcriptional regulator
MVYRTTPKMRERKEARRQKLLDVAVRMFGRKGYHATTVPMIVRAAKSSIGSFYFYFRNKEHIFAAVLEALGEQLSSALNQAIRASGGGPSPSAASVAPTLRACPERSEGSARAGLALGGTSAASHIRTAPGSDVLEQMKAAVKALVRFLAENPEEARILIVESSGLTKRLEVVRRRVIASHTRSVEQALRALSGSLPPLDPATVASCWVGAVLEAVFHWLQQPPEQRLPAEDLAESIARFNLRGIGARVEVIEEENHGKRTGRRKQPASGIGP